MSDSPALAVCSTTVSQLEQARTLASHLLRRRLVACAQIEGPIESHYQWQGKLCQDPEYRLVLKTTMKNVGELHQAIAELHPYEEPQIISVPCIDASPGYANWVNEQTQKEPT